MSRFLVPIGFFLLVALLWAGLYLDPREVPSPFIGRPAPQFTLPVLEHPDEVISPADMRGQVWMLNVWATWCVSCRAEHEVLLKLARETSIPIIGLNYKDENAAATRWLQQLGSPYVMNAVDAAGRAGIDWGVYGTPETFVIDKSGVIRHKQTGPVSEQILQQTILPLLKQLQAEQG
jgi:cytochrome c biogenesis protein CcmG/thiol:disulfide interchange protein DsbE